MPSNHHGEPKTLSEAIERLERATQSKSAEFREILGKDYSELRKAIDELKPHLGEVGERVSEKVGEARKQVESKVHENLWTTLAIVGLIGLVFGWIFGFSNRRD